VPTSFRDTELKALRDNPEIQIETWNGSQRHRTTIWVVVVGKAPYIRSYRGARGRWYREILRSRRAVVHAGRKKIPVVAAPTKSAAINTRVDRGYRDKYGGEWPDETKDMLLAKVKKTTLRLAPAAPGR
jgi:hypothetical protein